MAAIHVIIDFREVKEFGAQDVLDAMSAIDEAPVWDHIVFVFSMPPFHEASLRLALDVAFIAREVHNYKFVKRAMAGNNNSDGIMLHYRRYHLKDV